MVKNRDRWTITAIHPDGSLSLDGPTGTIRLPAGYVHEHVELGYAQTSHATQGRTVDVALLLIDTPTDSRGIYTPLTRGRDANHAYVVVEDNQNATDVLAQALSREWIDYPAIARRSQLDLDRARERPDPVDDNTHAARERILHSIEQRRARTRETEWNLGR